MNWNYHPTSYFDVSPVTADLVTPATTCSRCRRKVLSECKHEGLPTLLCYLDEGRIVCVSCKKRKARRRA